MGWVGAGLDVELRYGDRTTFGRKYVDRTITRSGHVDCRS